MRPPVHGIVLVGLTKHIEQAHGRTMCTALLRDAGLSDRQFTAHGEYPDAELFALVQALCDATGRSEKAVLEGFGRALAQDLVATYSFLVQPGWDPLELIEHTEQAIHTVVRTRTDATPPKLDVVRLNPGTLVIRYASERRLCSLAAGIVKGIGDLYRSPLQVTETSCAQRGSAFCVLEVRRTPDRDAPPTT